MRADESPQDRVSRQLQERLQTAALAERVVRLLSERGLTLAVAESDTGGLIGHLLTEVPGASACFLGGVVPYANAAKTALLGVPEDLLLAYGGVSREASLAMARGVRERFDADIGLATTGIAGPGGATAEKPLGLALFALVTRDGRETEAREVWDGANRSENKRRSAARALSLIEELLLSADT